LGNPVGRVAWAAGADALARAGEELAERQQQIEAHRELSSSLALGEVAS
jgi:hypothetical protein